MKLKILAGLAVSVGLGTILYLDSLLPATGVTQADIFWWIRKMSRWSEESMS